MDKLCPASTHRFECLAAQELLFFSPYKFRPKRLRRIEHLPVDLIDDGTALPAPLPLAREPGYPLPGLDRMYSMDFMAKPLHRSHSHKGGLAMSNLTHEQNAHRLAS